MARRAASAGEAVAAYKSILRAVLDARPSGMRLRLAGALGKNRSFVSQIANPAYPTPIPATHLAQIFETCRFSDKDRTRFLAAYGRAHPRHEFAQEADGATRLSTLRLPDLGDEARNAKMDRLVETFARDLLDIAENQ